MVAQEITPFCWRSKAATPPTESDGDHEGAILVWHLYQGAMTMHWKNAMNNRFVEYWAPLPPKPNGVSQEKE